MIKSKVIISLIVIGLGINFLGGCLKNPGQQSGTQPSTTQPAKSNKSQEYIDKWAPLNTTFQAYQVSVESFINSLSTIDNGNASNLNTKDAKAKIAIVNQAAIDLGLVSNITENDKKAIKVIIDAIKDINAKILNPAENGLTTGKDGSIATIQGNLKIQSPDGSIGFDPNTNTKRLIKQALNSNLTALQTEIQKLSPYPSSTPVTSASPAPGNEAIQQQIEAINKNVTALQNKQDGINQKNSEDLKALNKKWNQRWLIGVISGTIGGLLGVGSFALFNRLKKSQRNGRKSNPNTRYQGSSHTSNQRGNQDTRNQSSSHTSNQFVLLDTFYDLEGQFNRKVNEDKERDRKFNKLYQDIQYLIEENSKLQQQVKNLPDKPTFSSSIPVSHHQPQPSWQVQIPKSERWGNHTEIEVQPQIQSSPENELVTLWNNNPKALSQSIIAEVNESTDSMNARYGGSKNPPIVEKVARNQGSYWIIQWAGSPLYLVPKDTIAVNEFNFETTLVLFNCQGNHQDYKTIILRKPALVSAIAGEQWKLEEPGELQFD